MYFFFFGQDNILNVSGTFTETMRQIYSGVGTLSEGGGSKLHLKTAALYSNLHLNVDI